MTLGPLKFSELKDVKINGGASPPFSRTTLPSIQWLRAVAAIMVAIDHATYFSDLINQQSGQALRTFLGFSNWSFGIHIFFVVSGFIMIHTTHNFGETAAWRHFLMRRVIRVVPLYWLLTTVIVVGVLVSPHSLEIATDKFQYILRSYLFIPALRSEGDLRPILGQGWTLNYEMFFYC